MFPNQNRWGCATTHSANQGLLRHPKAPCHPVQEALGVVRPPPPRAFGRGVDHFHWRLLLKIKNRKLICTVGVF